ncbi:MAG: DUF5693 family protein [Oscillospiraceae bacterium]|nr:DUF5693 family protein [Oscillospiraceae bacterium]MCL2227703.1 DUF5693 family protein [Oscillospiraceae bacterium]
MSGKTMKSDKKGRAGLRWLSVIVLLAAFICALWVNFGLRLPVEAGDRTVGILVDYDELVRISNGSLDVSFQDMARKLSIAGATGLVVRERLLVEWEIAGDIVWYTGNDLRFQLGLANKVADFERASNVEIIQNYTYIMTEDELVFDQIFSLLYAKRRHPAVFEFNGKMGIMVNLHSSERATLGLGFPIAHLEQAAAEGLSIIPRLRNWEPVSRSNLDEVMRWVSKIPDLSAIGFNEPTTPGDPTDPHIIEAIADSIAPLGVPLVSFEFYDQQGLASVASHLDNYLLRVHAIAENELHRFADIQDALNRYTLAARERNIRFIYVRFQNLINPAAAMIPATELIEEVHDAILESGLFIGDPVPLPAFSIPLFALLMLGAGTIAAGGWLAALGLGRYFTCTKSQVLFLALLLLGMSAYVAGLLFFPSLARKVFALAGAIVFPSLGVVLVLNFEIAQASGIRRIIVAILQLGVMSAFTLVGAMIMSALLSEPVFMVKLDRFVGVTVSYLAPLAAVPFVLWLREEDCYGLLTGTAKSSVRFWQLGVSLIMLAGLALYVMRSGNDNPNAVMDIEMQMRQFLGDTLGVRPRTTEFLIGHPIMLVLLYFGYKFRMFPVLLIGVMGQVSLMNTYAHIHTPVAVSLRRSFHGMWLGVVIGIIFVLVLECALRQVRKLNASRKT